MKRQYKLAKTAPKHSGGIKPLNSPRTIHIRTDSNGNPTSIQVPPAIESPRARRSARRRKNTSFSMDSEQGSTKAALVSDGKWMRVVDIENLWKVNDEWWRGPDDEISRLYYVLRLENGQQITIYLDLISNSWYRQSG